MAATTELSAKIQALSDRLAQVAVDRDASTDAARACSVLRAIEAAFGPGPEIDGHLSTYVDQACLLYHEVNLSDAIAPEEARGLRRTTDRLLRKAYFLKQVYSAGVACVQAVQNHGSAEDGDDPDAPSAGVAAFSPMNAEELSKFQQLLVYLLNCAYAKSYRKYDGACFVEMFTPEGHKMHAWKKVYTIEEFVYDVTRKELNFEMWANLTSKQGNVSAAVDYLSHCRDVQFRTLDKDRRVFAFRNGTYFARTDAFVPHVSADAPGDKVACKFFDLDFDLEHAAAARDDWYDISTPNFQSILDFQEFTREVSEWMYVLLGRLIYEVGEMDGWQVIPYLKGQASSGKSTILLKVCRNFYDREDVGVLSNNIEKKFGLSSFADKYLFVAPEIKGDMQMEQAEFQSIVSGEDVLVNVKYQKAKSVEWRVPGIMAGNELPNWSDNAGSIVRRVILFDFKNRVDNGDMELGKKLQAEMGNLVLKCNRAYHAAVAKHAKTSIWTSLPDYFKATRADMTQDTNALEHFLLCDKLVLGADLYMPVNDFEQAFRGHCIDYGLQRTRGGIKNSIHGATLARHRVRVEKGLSNKEYPRGSGNVCFGAWMAGVDAASRVGGS